MDTDVGRHPWWQVMTIFDPDGTGGDFAYTVGLSTKGVPELHMWARPSLGDDPGDDWKFSLRDTGLILNQLSWRLLDGQLSVGDHWEEKYDGGLVTVRFRVDPAESAEALEAFQAGDVPVLPVRWSLHRPEPGPLTPMSPEAQTAAEQLYAELVAGLGQQEVPQIEGWVLPGDVCWDPGQKYGPRTPLVLARAVQLFAASREDWQDVFNSAIAVDYAHSLSYAAVVAQASANPVGRHAALRRLDADVQTLTAGFGRTWGVDARRAILEVFNQGAPEGSHDQVEHHLHRLVYEALLSHLTVEAVADVIDEQSRLGGQGPVLAGLAWPGFAPGDEWLASPEVVDVLLGLLRDISGDRLARAVHAWWTSDPESRGDVGALLQALTVTSAAYCPPLSELVPHGVYEAAAVVVSQLGSSSVWDLQPWATTVTGILTHRARLDGDDVARFAATAEPFLPGIGRVLDEPIVARR